MTTRTGPSRHLVLAFYLFSWGGLLVATASEAWAQDYTASGSHFAAGQERYDAKRYHTAALEFQAAYDAAKDPVLLYNVGEAWQKAGDAKKAALAYRGYVKGVPTAKDRPDVERRIAMLESKRTKLTDESLPGDSADADAMMANPGAAAAPLTPPTPDPAPAPDAPSQPAVVPPAEPVTPPPAVATEPPAAGREEHAPAAQIGILDDHPASKLRVAAWCSVAATIALLTTGAILGLAAQSRADEITRRLNFVDSSGQPSTFDAAAQSDYKSLRNDGRVYNGVSIGFYSATGAMAVTSIVLFLVDWKRGKDRAARQHADGGSKLVKSIGFSPTVTRGGAGLTLGGAF